MPWSPGLLSRYICLPDLLEALPRDEDGTLGRDAALWLFAPDAALGDRTPAEMLVDDPAA